MELDIIIEKDGTLRAHIKGVKGPGCLETVEMLKKAVGAQKEKKETSEFYEFDTRITGDVGRRA